MTEATAAPSKLPAFHFRLKDRGANNHLPALSKTFSDMNKHVSLSDVLKSANHEMKAVANPPGASDQGLEWEDGDQTTKKWTPQGLSCTADAAGDGKVDGREGWVVSWYQGSSSSPTSARVSFVDRDSKKYRHALLVYPDADDDFKEVPVHAGGIAWYGDSLWVADTHRGLRVFDLGNIWEVEPGDAVGKSSPVGGFSAANYRYVVPQKRWYEWAGAGAGTGDFAFSFVSLDRTGGGPDRLLVGDHKRASEGGIRRLVQWELAGADRSERLREKGDDEGVAEAVWAYSVPVSRMQGAVAAHGKIYIARSNEYEKGDMFGWEPGKAPNGIKCFFPPGPEDMTYDGNRKKLYAATEVSGSRYILSIDPKEVKF